MWYRLVSSHFFCHFFSTFLWSYERMNVKIHQKASKNKNAAQGDSEEPPCGRVILPLGRVDLKVWQIGHVHIDERGVHQHTERSDTPLGAHDEEFALDFFIA